MDASERNLSPHVIVQEKEPENEEESGEEESEGKNVAFFFLGGPYVLSFEINYDFVANQPDAIVGGVLFGYRF